MTTWFALIALAFAVIATVEWPRLPLIARLDLAVATAFALAAIERPRLHVPSLVAHDGAGYLLALACVAGLAAIVISLAALVRDSALLRR